MRLVKKVQDWMRTWQQMPTYQYPITVRCDRCGETITANIDLRNDLSIQYGESARADYYITRKSIVGGGQCFQRVEIELTFDRSRKLIKKTIQGGEFLNE